MESLEERFLYKNGTLKNKLEIYDKEKLAQFEYREVTDNAIKFLNSKILPIKEFKDIAYLHKLLFGDIYEWAGEVRDYNLTKGNTTFLPCNFMETGIQEVNKQISNLLKSTDTSKEMYAELLDKLNFLHPFREGNGRTAKIAIQKIAQSKSQYLDYDYHNDELIDALNKSDITAIAKHLSLKKLN